MNHLTATQISQHLHHNTALTFIGDGQDVTVDGRVGANALYMLDGAKTEFNWPTAQLVIDDPKAFHGTVSMGPASDVLLHVLATSYSYDPTHDLLSLYQGDKVVDTLKLEFHGGATFPSFLQSGGSVTDGWTTVATGYHGLAYGISEHVAGVV